LSAEGFYSARSEGVSAKLVQKIRLEHEWYSAYHRSRNATTVDGYLTVNGLAARLGVGRRRIYRIIEQRHFGPDQVIRSPQGKGWLIRDEAEIIHCFQ
jgi:predicted DNA-binding transcriptional regulator AlpA